VEVTTSRRLSLEEAKIRTLEILAKGPETKINLFRVGYYYDMTKVCRELEAAGLVGSSKDEGERVAHWFLTDAGRKALGSAENTPGTGQGGGDKPTTAVSRHLTVTQGNINNNYLSLASVLDLFPEDVIGGSQAAPKTLRIEWGQEVVETDIDQTKNIFRSRGWVRQFFADNEVRAGDQIRLEQLEPYVYRVSKIPNVGEPSKTESPATE
jgi:DNA-binding MarR family transcriptional regulator